MDEVKNLLDAAKVENLQSEMIIANLLAALDLLVIKIEDLEKKIESMQP